jgi:exodeoxyribonuclease V alpha subunit
MITPPLADSVETADIDRHFGSFIARFGGDTELAQATAALISRAVRQGDICLDLRDPFFANVSTGELKFPEPDEWVRRLGRSPAFGPPERSTPIVLAGHCVFLRRYWDYEQALARSILSRARRNAAVKDASLTQNAAIQGALKNYFSIISGAPGTGKTTTVLEILQRFVEESGNKRPRIALAAPTGKAAARLQELLRNLHQDSAVDEKLKQSIPTKASTIHRLLGSKPDSVFFRHDSHNPLPLDLLVVDEASMVALPLMAKLFDAVPENARVILLGDKDQLASVEPGAVLADMAGAALAPKSPLRNALFILSKNYRFGNENAIYRLSSAVRVGNADEALGILAEQDSAELGSSTLPPAAQLARQLEELVVEQYKGYLVDKHPLKALDQFARFRVLCALRESPFGVRKVNEAIEGILHRRTLIPDPSRLYPGMPLLITRNDYQVQLFNGDIGVILPDPRENDGRQLWAWFIGADNQPRRLSPGRLPDYELAYAMTVHKAQGSQFERVLFILPDRDSPVLSRELIYTGVTRASKRVDVWFTEPVLSAAIARQAIRRSGLRDALCGDGTRASQ